MALTSAQYKTLILTELMDTSGGLLAANIDLLWSKNDIATTIANQYLLTKRDAIYLLLGAVRQQVNFQALDGASVDLSDLFKHLMALLSIVQAQIEAAGLGYVVFSHTPKRVDGFSIQAEEDAA